MNINRLCPGCMRDLGEAWTARTQDADGKESQKTMRNRGKCPHCGFDFAAYRGNSRCLPIYTILAGKYLVGAVLGEGGFGITYMGYDLNMQTRIAIKEYFPVELVSRDTTSLTGDRVISLSGEKSATYQQGLQKYVTEAQNVSQFSEIPGVVSVKDFFYENETAYIVMEYIDGISLKDYLKERGGRLAETEALAIMKPILEALEKVHEAGIIHRDISPDNIMLTFEGEREGGIGEQNLLVGNSARIIEGGQPIASVKLIDFGAARMAAKNDQRSLTIILKHGYAPEEQYRTHGEQGPWTDVYAVCAVLYRMLTGQTPVPAMDRLFQDNLKSFEALSANVSKSTQTAILKGLAVKKEDRIQSIRELAQVLYEGKSLKVSLESLAKKQAVLMGGGITLILAAAVTGSIFLFRQQKKQEILAESQSLSQNQAEISAEFSTDTNVDGVPKERAETVAGIGGASDSWDVTIDFETEMLGEAIVSPEPQTSISLFGGHILFRMPDGTVKARGSNNVGQCLVQDWEDIAAVAAGFNHSLGLRLDGRVLAVGWNEYGQCDVGNWENVIQIAAGSSNSYGLTVGGQVLACGYNEDGHLNETAEWENITAIVSSDSDEGYGLIGVDSEGNIHYAGMGDDMPVVTGWQDVKHLSFASEIPRVLIGLKADGSVVKAQLDQMPIWVPEHLGDQDPSFLGVENWTQIQQISSKRPVLGVKNDGKIMFKDGSLLPGCAETLSGWVDMESVTMAGTASDYVIGLKKDGSILEWREQEEEITERLEWIHAFAGATDVLVAGSVDGNLLSYGRKLSDMPIGNPKIADLPIRDVPETDLVLTKDGKAFAYVADMETGWQWQELGEGVKQIQKLWGNTYWDEASGEKYTTYGFLLLLEEGKIECCIIGDKIPDNLAHYKEAAIEACQWEHVVQIEVNWGDDIYGLHTDGTVSTTVPYQKETIASCRGIKKITGRSGNILGIREDGMVEVIIAQNSAVMFGMTQVSAWTNIRDISMGQSHVAGLQEDGTVVAVGSNHEGQCDVEGWTDIVYLTTGRNCTLGITSDGQLKMAGYLY